MRGHRRTQPGAQAEIIVDRAQLGRIEPRHPRILRDEQRTIIGERAGERRFAGGNLAAQQVQYGCVGGHVPASCRRRASLPAPDEQTDERPA
jgi:hypothetical protein